MKFSVITPVTYDIDNADNLRMPRYDMFLRCADSMRTQQFRDFEWVVCDDICNPSAKETLKAMKLKIDYKVVKLPEKSGRVIARNKAMLKSKGEWICWLDADDEYSSVYLQAFDQAIKLNPEYKLFNMNHLIFDYNYKTHVRKFIDMSIQKDIPFPSGTIGAGSYVFHRSLFEEIGPLPELGVWDLATWAFEKYPEIKPFYVKRDADGKDTEEYNSLGNPWGEDWLYFYMMTRKYPSKYLDTALYYVHQRWGHRWPEDPDYMVDPGKNPEWTPTNQ